LTHCLQSKERKDFHHLGLTEAAIGEKGRSLKPPGSRRRISASLKVWKAVFQGGKGFNQFHPRHSILAGQTGTVSFQPTRIGKGGQRFHAKGWFGVFRLLGRGGRGGWTSASTAYPARNRISLKGKERELFIEESAVQRHVKNPTLHVKKDKGKKKRWGTQSSRKVV